MNRDLLKRLIDYNQETGVFTWRARPRVRAGKIAGHQRTDGYIEIRVNWELHLAHRLAWLYMTGEFPKEHTDHINGKRDDNRFTNLREATNSLNMQNQKKATNRNAAGFLGVQKNCGGRHQAVLTLNGERHRFGTFDTPEQAHAAYLVGKRRLHPGGTL